MTAPEAGQERRVAYRRGRRSETLALWCLRLKGYRILARDLRSPVGEIDIIACRGRMLAIIEVKARDTADSAIEAVSPRQQARIVRAADRFLAGRPQLAGFAVRFDVIMVTPGRWPRHLPDAWRPGADSGAAKW